MPKHAPDDLSRARSALHYMDAGCDGQRWVRIGMAAKAAGLTLEDFDAWSAMADNYGGQADTRTRWRSFRDDGGITAATLFHLAREDGWREGASRADVPQQTPATKRKPEPVRQPRYKAADVWDDCTPATPEHGYITRKGGQADGLRVYPDSAAPLTIMGQDVRGWLVAPAFDAHGDLTTLQFISPAPGAPKLNLPGHSVSGFFKVGELRPGQPAYIVEGIGQAWSAHMATGCAALVAFGAGNQRKVAASAKLLGARPVLVADRGKEAKCERAAADLGCAWVAMPSGLPDNGDINDIQQADGPEAVAAVLAGERLTSAPKAANDNNPQAFGFTRVADMLHHLKPIDWLVRGYLEGDSLALLFGDPGCGKSFVAIDLACAVATGLQWHGKATKSGAVFYIAGEGHNGLTRRFKAWEILNGCDLADAPLYVSHRSASLYDAVSAASVSEAVQALAAASGQHPRLIVVDTLARNFGGADENSTSDMNAFVTNLDAHLKERFGACVLIVHHTGHADKTRARGAMALKGALDAEYQLDRGEDGLIRWNTTKMKDAEHPEPLSFRLERVALPFLDEDGQPVFGAAPTSAAYVPPKKTGKAGRGKHQTAAMQALADLEREYRDRLEASGQDADAALVKLDSWENRLLRDMGMDRRRFYEVKQTLIEQGLIELVPGGYVRTV